MLKAIIMDFDGVIIDTELVWYEIFRKWFMENKNYDLAVEEFLICVGSNAEKLFDSLKRDHNIDVDEMKFFEDTQNLFRTRSSLLPVICGVTTFIESVKREGLKLALATSSARPKPVEHLSRLNLIDKFDDIVTADEVKRIKPYPDLFLKAAQNLNVKSDEVLIVEDSPNGFIAGKNAKMRVLVVPNEITKYCDFAGCYKQVTSLEDYDVKEMISYF